MRWHCNRLPRSSTTEQQHSKREREKGISLAQHRAGSTGGSLPQWRWSWSRSSSAQPQENNTQLKGIAPARQNNPAFIAHISKCVNKLPEYLNNFMYKIFVQMYYASFTQAGFHICKLSLTNPYPGGILPGRLLHAFDGFSHWQTTEALPLPSYSAAV